ncbi:PucR family transcriptional regulator ligand-binding domain-containing protein [Brevibacillus ruminantium]|uniref:PucR family transcriptional regulator ligand-binding domain-containing protein n=1 Tax=Brevibacillus ruminantium TaxID=2950604 RepID=A0ABY4WHE9_9BACL|nr:PucR family transcriptional regulator [Brevibacillus ruminantium]USG66241.1 PucR family transcriptional regulator ligand-binding domain-containing protein [Brevibacillus ruminantium]
MNGVTIRELMEIPPLKDARVISGFEGVDRVVRYIDIMEVPDLRGWLREGELLLTTAYSIRHDPSRLPEIVEHMAQAGAAALAIKPERFLHDLPEEMILVSNRYQLPIIELPAMIPYMDITHAVMEQVLDRQAALLRRSDEVYRTLTTMVLENSGLQAVADNIAGLVKGAVRVLDNFGQVIVSVPPDWKPKSKHLEWDIAVDRQIVGKLQVDKERLDDIQQVCVEQARVVVALELMRAKTAVDTEKRLRGNLIDELLSAVPPARHEVERRGRQLGLNPLQHWEVAIIEGNETIMQQLSSEASHFRQTLDREAQQNGLQAHIESRHSSLVLLLSSKPVAVEPSGKGKRLLETDQTGCIDWCSVIERLLQEQSGKRHDIHIGKGGSYPLWHVHQSYTEARKALAIGVKLSRPMEVTAFPDVEAFQLLAESVDQVHFSELFERKLGKLHAHDLEHGSDFLRTLYYYLESSGNLIETSNRLYIHRNSVKYRLQRIREIIPIDLSCARQRFVYHLCLTYHYLKTNE